MKGIRRRIMIWLTERKGGLMHWDDWSPCTSTVFVSAGTLFCTEHQRVVRGSGKIAQDLW